MENLPDDTAVNMTADSTGFSIQNAPALRRAALYCRLSREDLEKEGEVSESIRNQKRLLEEYAKAHDFQVAACYIDDDYSGLYAERPQFARMIADAERGLFTAVLAKSQSRFTRNMEHLEKYLHKEFPRMGIRFISITDHMDTDDAGNKKSRQITGLMNEWYCEDLSANIRSVLHRKKQDGEFTGAFAVYGYRKSIADPHKLEVDPEAAEVVKRIFRYYLEGYGAAAIAEMLSAQGILTPAQYKRERRERYAQPNRQYALDRGIWSASTIKRILSDETYTGKLVQGKYRKVNFKSRRVEQLPKAEWIVRAGTHAAVIEEDTFEQVQKQRESRRMSSRADRGAGCWPDIPLTRGRAHPLAGKVYCADCGHPMIKTSAARGSGYSYFICRLCKRTKGAECSRHSIRCDLLTDAIIGNIGSHVGDFLGDEFAVRAFQKKRSKDHNGQTASGAAGKTSALECELTRLKTALAALYVEKVNGDISEEEYKMLKEQLASRKKYLETEKPESLRDDSIQQRGGGTSSSNKPVETTEDLVKKLIDKHSGLLIEEFVRKIEIKESGAEREAVIHWNI